MKAATSLLRRISAGDRAAAEELTPLVYEELRRLAHSYMARERAGHTLQATELVHEAWERLVGGELRSWEDRAHFFRSAARAMRNVLVDHARARAAVKRGGGEPLDTAHLDRLLDSVQPPSVNILALHEAVERLAVFDDLAARAVELRFFTGMSVPETARVLGTSVSTVERTWRLARAWLRKELEGA